MFLKKWQYLILLIFESYLQILQASQFMDPGIVFPLTKNALTPTIYWLENKKPYSTNAWFINLVLAEKNNSPQDAVNIFPYSLKMDPQGISLSYTGPIYYAETDNPTILSAFYYQFDNQLTLGANLPLDQYGLESYKGLGITLQWQKGKQKITAPIFQGSPYLTEFYRDTIPKLSTRFKIKSINQQTQSGALTTSQRYEFTLELNPQDTQTWVLYSEKPIALDWIVNAQGNHLLAKEPYTGWLRLVLLKDSKLQVNNNAEILDSYSATIPLDYQQNYSITDNNLIYSFTWHTENNKAPLMLSLPHQRNINPENPSISYPGIKGLMVGETKALWEIKLPRVPIVFLEPKNLSPANKILLTNALQAEAQDLLEHPFPDDGPYQVGKRYARAARLILIADRLEELSLQKKMIAFLEMQLTKKMLAKGKWFFQYDTTWGGIIPNIDDYGSRHYNDHHFHYGYWVYTLAVIAKFDPDWLRKPLKAKEFTPQQWTELLIKDYANPDDKDPYFPLQRYQDDYAGHSWASGLVPFVDGQNQQSSSEAVNAYYALSLYAKAVGDSSLFDWGEFLMTRELISAQTYWQIPKNSLVYSEQFKEHNQVIANLWDNKIDSNPFFVACDKKYRCGLEYSFGIEMLPFTAITLELLNKNWLKEIYPTIKKLIENEYGPISPAWKWILIKGVASIMDKEEKEALINKVTASAITDYDHGDSKTNTLYFLM